MAVDGFLGTLHWSQLKNEEDVPLCQVKYIILCPWFKCQFASFPDGKGVVDHMLIHKMGGQSCFKQQLEVTSEHIGLRET